MTIEAAETQQAMDPSIEAKDLDDSASGKDETSNGDSKSESKAADETKDDDEVVVTIGDEEPPAPRQPTPQWVKETRKENRAQRQRIRELEAQLNAQAPAQRDAAPVLGKKPTLEQNDYDTAKHEAALDVWYAQKRKVDDHAAATRAEEEKAQASQSALHADYVKKKAALRAADYEDAESLVAETLSLEQQNLLLRGAGNAALVALALGRSPERLRSMASIKDPAKFLVEIGKMEAVLKVSGRKPPQPESKVSGSAPKSGVVDSQLAKLEAEAERTGDRSKIAAYKRDQKRKHQKE